MWNWIAAFGVLIELVGFSTLGFELVRTLKSDILDNIKVSKQKMSLDRLSVVQADQVGEVGGIMLEGGQLGELIDQINSRQMAMRERMQLIIIGIGTSAIGCLLQLVGGFGQAIY